MGPNQNSNPIQPLSPNTNTAPATPVAQTQTPAQTINPMPATPTSTPDEKKEGSVGALIGSIIIVIVIVLGGLYFWGKALEKSNLPTPTGDETSLAPSGLEGDDLSAAAGSTTLTKLPPSNSLSANDEIAQIEAALAGLQSINSNSDLAALGE